MSARCVACSGLDLVLDMRVRGVAGPQGLIPTTDRFGMALADIVRCRRCGHRQLERMPDDSELSEAYEQAASDDYISEEEGQRATARTILKRIELHRQPGELADLGCWVGYLLSEAQKRGWRTAGVEPSDFASRYARDQLGLEVSTGDLFAADLPMHRFDAVFMGDVIEHIPAADAAVQEARKFLVPGGVLALTLPDAGSWVARLLGRRWWSVIPTHVHYFTRHSIGVMLTRQEFEVVEICPAPKTFSVQYYVDRLGGYWDGLARRLVQFVDAIGVADRLWTPNLRDRMLVVARMGGHR